MIKAAIFDWDGTLVDTFPVALEAFRQVFGPEFTEENLKCCFGRGVRSVVREFMENKGVKLTDDKIQKLARKKTLAQVAMTEKTRLLPGVLELLETLRGNNIKMAISSSNYAEVIRPVLELHGLTDYFEIVVTCDDVPKGRSKPLPDMFLKAAEGLGLPPEACCAFEDSPIGIQSAKAAKMRVIAVCTGPFSKEEIANERPELLVDTLEDARVIRFFGI